MAIAKEKKRISITVKKATEEALRAKLSKAEIYDADLSGLVDLFFEVIDETLEVNGSIEKDSLLKVGARMMQGRETLVDILAGRE